MYIGWSSVLAKNQILYQVVKVEMFFTDKNEHMT